MTPDEGSSALTVEQIFSNEPADQSGQPRDDAGRFAPKPGESNEAPAATTEPPAAATTEPVAQQPDHRIPLAEHLSEREKRQAAERRAEDLERHIANLSRQQNREPPKPIDLLENPEGYAQSLESRIERRLLSRFLDASFEDAHAQHGDAFAKAYGELERSGDQGLINRIVNAGNPGRALMRWHQEREAIREIGGDLPGYRKKLLTDDAFRKDALGDQSFIDAVLASPDVRKRAMEVWRDQAQSQPSATVTSLPSLSRAPAAREAADSGLGSSDRERFDNVFAARR